jgi:excisionase family DNA binding protein
MVPVPFRILRAGLVYATRVERGEGYMRALKSVTEAAEILGISPWTVRKYIRKGKLGPVRIGRRVLLEEEEIARFIAKRRDPMETVQEDAGDIASSHVATDRQPRTRDDARSDASR